MVIGLTRIDETRQSLEDINFDIEIEEIQGLKRVRKKVDFLDYYSRIKKDVEEVYRKFLTELKDGKALQAKIYVSALDEVIDVSGFEGFPNKIINAQQVIYKALLDRINFSEIYQEALEWKAAASMDDILEEKAKQALARKQEVDNFSLLLNKKTGLLRQASNEFIKFLEFAFSLRMALYARAFCGKYDEEAWGEDIKQARDIFERFRPYALKINGKVEKGKQVAETEDFLIKAFPLVNNGQRNQLAVALEKRVDLIDLEKQEIENYSFPNLPFYNRYSELGFYFFPEERRLRDAMKNANKSLSEIFEAGKKFATDYRENVIASIASF